LVDRAGVNIANILQAVFSYISVWLCNFSELGHWQNVARKMLVKLTLGQLRVKVEFDKPACRLKDKKSYFPIKL